jgi:hypothetical protein
MTTMMNELKPAAALAMSALMGAAIVLGAVSMLGSAAHIQPALSTPQVLVGISRFNTTDIRVVPSPRPLPSR